MSRNYCKELTKEMLEKFGFTKIEQQEDGSWLIERLWRKNSSKAPVLKRIAVTKVVRHHKYTGTKEYLKITFSYHGRGYSLPLSRVIYAWHIGPVFDGEVIDHLNNDQFDNNVYNLQKLSVGENLAKRFLDNPNCPVNQYKVR